MFCKIWKETVIGEYLENIAMFYFVGGILACPYKKYNSNKVYFTIKCKIADLGVKVKYYIVKQKRAFENKNKIMENII